MAFWNYATLFQGIVPFFGLANSFAWSLTLFSQAAFSKAAREGSAELEPGVSFFKDSSSSSSLNLGLAFDLGLQGPDLPQLFQARQPSWLQGPLLPFPRLFWMPLHPPIARNRSFPRSIFSKICSYMAFPSLLWLENYWQTYIYIICQAPNLI